MRNLVYILLFMLFVISCDSPTSKVNKSNLEKAKNNRSKENETPIISFENKRYDFGEIETGKPYNYTFKFKNEGKSPLIIFKVKSSCGCTVADYPKEPIKEGDTGEIKIVFTPTGKGMQSKGLEIISNSIKGSDRLSIKAKVK